MGKHQIITAPNGDELVVLPRADYEELLRIAEEAAEDAADVAAYDAAMSDPLSLEPMPFEISHSMLQGNSLLKSIRLWRGLSETEVAEAIGRSIDQLAELESRRRSPDEELAEKLAAALAVPVNWII
jgi:hypothetical protein